MWHANVLKVRERGDTTRMYRAGKSSSDCSSTAKTGLRNLFIFPRAGEKELSCSNKPGNASAVMNRGINVKRVVETLTPV